jgi:adenylyltransferase/sulfurtransferase
MGHWQAAEAIKILLGIADGLNGHTLIFDLKTNSQQTILENLNPSCPLCGPHPRIRVIEPANYFSADKMGNPYTVNVAQINEKEVRTSVFVDIRETIERSRNPVKHLVCVNLPFSKFEEWKSSFSENKHYYLLCEKGSRSQKAVEALRDQGYKNIFAIQDGIAAVNLFEEQRHAANRG